MLTWLSGADKDVALLGWWPISSPPPPHVLTSPLGHSCSCHRILLGSLEAGEAEMDQTLSLPSWDSPPEGTDVYLDC